MSTSNHTLSLSTPENTHNPPGSGSSFKRLQKTPMLKLGLNDLEKHQPPHLYIQAERVRWLKPTGDESSRCLQSWREGSFLHSVREQKQGKCSLLPPSHVWLPALKYNHCWCNCVTWCWSTSSRRTLGLSTGDAPGSHCWPQAERDKCPCSLLSFRAYGLSGRNLWISEEM